MSIQALIDGHNSGDSLEDDDTAPPSAATTRAVPRKDFGDLTAEAYEKSFPSADRRTTASASAAPPAEPERFEPAGKADFGDRVAAAYDQLFPPRGETP